MLDFLLIAVAVLGIVELLFVISLQILFIVEFVKSKKVGKEFSDFLKEVSGNG